MRNAFFEHGESGGEAGILIGDCDVRLRHWCEDCTRAERVTKRCDTSGCGNRAHGPQSAVLLEKTMRKNNFVQFVCLIAMCVALTLSAAAQVKFASKAAKSTKPASA